jgi:tripartite-type tricarboxylate transporter receptor subunit TctC
MLNPPTALQHVRAGRLKALAVAAPARSEAMPDVPTLDEVGIKNVYTSTFYGVMAPAGTPKEIVDRLNKEINAILQTPEMRKRMADLGAAPGTGSPEDFEKFVVGEIKRYAEIVKLSGAQKIE